MREGDNKIWSARIEVVPEAGNDIFGDDPGAYSNFIALCSSVAELVTTAEEAMATLHLQVRAVEDVKIVDLDAPQPDLTREAIAAVQAGDPWAYDTFYVYRGE
jgi:hypothetical protein